MSVNGQQQDRKDEEEDEEEGRTKTVFLNPHDRNGKLLSKRFTTRKVSFKRSIVVDEEEGDMQLTSKFKYRSVNTTNSGASVQS